MHHKSKKLEELIEKLLDICTTLSTDWDQFVEIYHILEKIQDIEQVCALPKLNREDNFESFAEWCTSNGAVNKKAVISHFEDGGGYGFRVTESLKENEMWLNVPRKLLLNHDSVLSSPLGLLMTKDPILSQMPNIALAIHLLNERCNENSFWTPYIKIFPDTYDTPMYFTLTELELLRGSSSLDSAIKLCRNVARQYAYFYKLFKTQAEAKGLALKEFFTYDNYRWAVSTVMTRQNSIPSADGSTQNLALVPLWDMCNHSNGKLSTDYNCEKNQLESYAFRNFEAGEQLNIFYGSRSNADFLLNNGFVYPENQFDSVAIKLELRKSDQLYAKKEELLSLMEIPVCGLFYIYNGPSPIEGAIIAFHRIAVMNSNALEKYNNNKENLAQLKELRSDLDDKTESLCWKLLDMRVCRLLEGYASAIEEDEALLASGALSLRGALAVQLRWLEKKILRCAKDFIAARDSS